MLVPVIWRCPECQNVNKENPSDDLHSTLRYLYYISYECKRCHKFFDILFKFRPAAYVGKIINHELDPESR